ncbi:MAG: GspE/PulE family protein [Candidatus Paceibacterota bacterium]|jgi:type IV pilus assembly protein PilB
MKIALQILKPLLLQTSLVSEEQFGKALELSKRTGQSVSDLLISQGVITQDYLIDLLSKFFNTPRVKVSGKEINPEFLNLIPEDIARARNAIIFDRKDDYIYLAVTDPTDLESINFIQRYTSLSAKVFLTTDDDLKSAFALYRKQLTENFANIIEDNLRKVSIIEGMDLTDAASEMPIVSLFDTIVIYAYSLTASDIHIERLSDSILIRFRVDGILREVVRLPKEIHNAIVARVKILAGLQIDEHYRAQDGRFKYQKGDDAFDVRVSILPTFYGEKINMRLLLGAVKPMSFEELGMEKDTIEIMNANVKRSYGMILVTGPTGSGKTTTLYSVLSKLNRPEVNIVTVEDPIEYELRYVNQVQVNTKSGLDFANGLRSILRQDPNIIMVGEIRDSETAAIAVNAALTGHLVLSTLHTNDATTAVPRLFDLGVQQFLVSATVNAVIAQRLVRKICRNCIESYKLPNETKLAIERQFKNSSLKKKNYSIPAELYHGKGCKFCNNTGYKGRVAIYEIFNVSEDMRTYIQSSEFSLDGLREIAGKYNMVSLFEDGVRKAQTGQTSIEEVFRVIKE